MSVSKRPTRTATLIGVLVAVALVTATVCGVWRNPVEEPLPPRAIEESRRSDHGLDSNKGVKLDTGLADQDSQSAHREQLAGHGPPTAVSKSVKGGISGVVRDSFHRVVPRASVRAFFRGKQVAQGLAGPNGRYELPRIPSITERQKTDSFMGFHSFVLEASARGFFPHRRRFRGETSTDFVLGRPGVLSGRVILVDPGAGAVGARVTARLQPPSSGAPGGALTDSRGAFRIPGLKPGTYKVAAAKGSRLFHADTSVEVRSGEESSCTILLRQGANVTGKVVDESTALPIENAAVFCDLTRKRSTTDAQGRFVFVGVPTGLEHVDSERRVYHRKWFRAHAKDYVHREFNVDLQAADKRLGIHTVVKLTRKSVVTGTVVGPDSQPVAGASVRTTTHEEAISDDTGFFRLCVRPNERFRIIARKVGFCPAVSSELGPEAVESRPKVQLKLGNGATLLVRVKDDSGAPIAHAKVILLDRDQNLGIRREATTDQGGEARVLEIPEETYRLSVHAEDCVPATIEEMRVLGGSDSGLSVSLRRGKIISGRVVDDRGCGMEGVRVVAFPVSRSNAAGSTKSASSGRDGAFRIGGLASGRWYLRFHKIGCFADESSRTVESGVTDLVINPGFYEPLEIQGRIIADRKSAGAGGQEVRAYLCGAGPASYSGSHRVRVSCEEGRFRLRGLRAGTYCLEAVTSGGLVMAKPTQVTLRKHRGRPLVVELRADTELPRPIQGRVEGPAGAPVPNARVAAYLCNGTHEWPVDECLASIEGEFRLKLFRPGQYRLEASHPKFVRCSSVAHLLPRGAARHMIKMASTSATLRVRVLDRQGRPIRGATVLIRRPNGQVLEPDAFKYEKLFRQLREREAGIQRLGFLLSYHLTNENGEVSRRFLPQGAHIVEVRGVGRMKIDLPSSGLFQVTIREQ